MRLQLQAWCSAYLTTLAWSLTLDIGLNNYFMEILGTDVKENESVTSLSVEVWHPLLFSTT